MPFNDQRHRVRLLRAGLLSGLLATVGCSSRPHVAVLPTPAFPQTFSFVATSPADSSLQGTFEGTATLANGWLTLTVPRITLTFPPGDAESWRNLTVRAFVATDYSPGNWKAVAQSRPVNVFRFIPFFTRKWSERRTVTLEQGVTLTVPVPPGATAATSRLAFEMEWVYVMGTYGDTDSRTAISGAIPPP
jgi:hypothetical protein